MSKLRVISDVHGCIDDRTRFNNLPSYIELCHQLGPDDYSVQLGDMGFDYTKIIENLDSNHHRFIKGNHDLHEEYMCMNALGNGFDENRYGPCTLGPFNFFFVSGGFSIDMKYRLDYEKQTGVKTWFEEEQLSFKQRQKCLEIYTETKPDVVFSHDCSTTISEMIGNPEILVAFGWPRDMATATQELLEKMFNIHRPKLHIFGHYHKNWNLTYHGTTYMCIAERQYVDFDTSWNVIGGTCYDK